MQIRGKDNLTLQGAVGTVLDGASSHRLLEVFPGTVDPAEGFNRPPYMVNSAVTLLVLEFTNGFSTSFGGAMVIYPEQSVVARRLTFDTNFSTGDASALYVAPDASIELYDSWLEGNVASSWGTMVVDEGASAKVHNTSFIDNLIGDRGAFFSQYSASIELVDCVFDGNFATDPQDPLRAANAIHIEEPELNGSVLLRDVGVFDPENCREGDPNSTQGPIPQICANSAIFTSAFGAPVVLERMIIRSWFRAWSLEGNAVMKDSVLGEVSVRTDPEYPAPSEIGAIFAHGADLELTRNLFGKFYVGGNSLDPNETWTLIWLETSRLVAHNNLFLPPETPASPRAYKFFYFDDPTGLITHDIRGNLYTNGFSGGGSGPPSNDPLVFPTDGPHCKEANFDDNCRLFPHDPASMEPPPFPREGLAGKLVRTFDINLPRAHWDLAVRDWDNAKNHGLMIDGERRLGPQGLPGSPADLSYYDDSDNDGFPNGWELRYGLDSNTANLETDLSDDVDPLTLLDEYEAGTDPTLSDTDGDHLTDSYVAMGPDFNNLNPCSQAPILQDCPIP